MLTCACSEDLACGIHALQHCVESEVEEATDLLDELWRLGYSAIDICSTIFRCGRVCNNVPVYKNGTLDGAQQACM